MRETAEKPRMVASLPGRPTMREPLAGGRGDDESEAAGDGGGAMDGLGGGDGGLAPLAGAIEEAAAGLAFADEGLDGVGGKGDADPVGDGAGLRRLRRYLSGHFISISS